MTTRGSHLKRSLLGVAAALVAVSTLGLGAATANAAPGNVDPDRTGSITVNKFTQPDNPGSVPGDGSKLDTLPAGAKPIAGVEFTVTPVTGLDLSTPAYWDGLGSMTVDAARALGTGTATTATTATDGSAAFSGLPVGLYIVEETNIANGMINGEPANITAPGAPYLVTIPTVIDDEWVYDVHTYPKNSVNAVEKQVVEPGTPDYSKTHRAWSITATAPKLGAGDTLKALRLSDTLDSRLTFESIADVTYAGAALVEGTDYTVEVQGQTVALSLTATGIARVAGDSGRQLSYVIHTKVNDLGDDGVISNDVQYFTNLNDIENQIDSDPAVSEFGSIRIDKADGSNQKALAGAKFSVYASEADARAKTNALANDAGETVFVTDDNGSTLIPSLATDSATHQRDYWIAEIEAPAGYVLLADPVKVTVKTAGTATPTVQVVENQKTILPNLPITGGVGTAMLTVAGLLVLGGAVFMATRMKRRATA
ncbi:SpaH/EbpB family LPXTG-anchored major pilin [Leucobacter sp. USCH14]|uniref:SpaH/EbpB family LPXTG-anchored major pilin n=1 Tax=Leucobacter sp. USCH14 TaxID=3024838 RepID=UPI0030A46A7A